MPHTKPQRSRMEAPLEAQDIELYHVSRHRSGAHAPPAAPSRSSSSDDVMPRVAVRPGLYVTSTPHPFWSTKKGIALSVLVVFSIIAGIVGGILGAKKGNNDTSRRNFGLPSSVLPTTTTTPTTSAVPTSTSIPTETPTPSVDDSSAAGGGASATTTAVSEVQQSVTARSVPRRYLLPFVSAAPQMTLAPIPAVTLPPSSSQ